MRFHFNIQIDNYNICNVSDVQNMLQNKYSYNAITTKAKKMRIAENNYWSENEIELLNLYYPTCTLDEMVLILPNRNRKTIIAKAADMGIKNVVKYNKEQEEYIVNNWETMTDEEIAIKINKTRKGVRDKRLLMGLLRLKEESSYNDLSEFIRRNNLNWKERSMIQSGYKCVFTGDRFQAIHHIHGLNLILNETLGELSIPVKKCMNDYTEIELRNILDLFRIKQDQYPLGICLRDDIHKLFHHIYGYGYNTEVQWKEFKQDFRNGKYLDVIKVA